MTSSCLCSKECGLALCQAQVSAPLPVKKHHAKTKEAPACCDNDSGLATGIQVTLYPAHVKARMFTVHLKFLMAQRGKVSLNAF